MTVDGFALELERRARASYELIGLIAETPDDERGELCRRLHVEAHTLRGAALVLGLDEAAAFAADVEQLALGCGKIDAAALGERLEGLLATLPNGAAQAAAPARRGAVRGAHRVLCIDDSEANLLLLQRFLERRDDVEFVPARSGEEGLVLAAAERPDLILLDLQLPGLTGIGLLQLLRADPGTAEIPVVVVSADAHREQVAAAQALGARDYLVKPLDLVRLGDVVDAVLGRAAR